MSELNGPGRRLTVASPVGLGPLVLIGQGGSASVYHAHDLRSERPVAIKIMDVGELSPATQRRFEREARALASLSAHPNIVTVHTGGVTPDGQPYLVMDLAQGGSLAERLRRHKRVPAVEVVSLGRELLGALEAAHEIGIAHRDITPGNVLLSSAGRPQLSDFMLSSIPASHRARSLNATAATAFAAPEVINGRPPDRASDLYSLAATLAALIIGRPVFTRGSKETSTAYIYRILRDPPRSLEPYGVSRKLSDVLHKGMAKSPAGRYPSAAAFLAALAEVPEAAPAASQVTDVADATVATVAADAAPVVAGGAHRAVPGRSEPAVDGTRRRRPPRAVLLVAAVLVVAAAITTAALWPGASHSNVAVPRSPVADVSSSVQAPVGLAALSFTSTCVGRRCTFAFSGPAVAASRRLIWQFGDGTTRSGPATVAHRYRSAGRYTASLDAGRDGQSVTSKAVAISIIRWPRTLQLRAGSADSAKITVTVTGPARCRPASYTLERRSTTWQRVHGGRITSPVTTLRVPGASTYRLHLAETDRSGGFCPAALSAPVTVRAARHDVTPPAATPTSAPPPTTATTATPTTPTAKSTPPPATHPPPPIKYTPPPLH